MKFLKIHQIKTSQDKNSVKSAPMSDIKKLIAYNTKISETSLVTIKFNQWVIGFD